MKNASADLDKILKKNRIDSELEFERASIIDRKLRVMVKEQPELGGKRQALRTLLKAYEDKIWVNGEISDDKIRESDIAELVADQERMFFSQRKELIRKKLHALSLTQKDLGRILGHKSVTYISELINGINAFTTHDLVIIHLLLKIDFRDLIPTVLNPEERNKLTHVVGALNNPKVTINEESLELVAC